MWHFNTEAKHTNLQTGNQSQDDVAHLNHSDGDMVLWVQLPYYSMWPQDVREVNWLILLWLNTEITLWLSDSVSRLMWCIQILQTEGFFVMSVLLSPLTSHSKLPELHPLYASHFLSDCISFHHLQCLLSVSVHFFVTSLFLYLVSTTPRFLSMSVCVHLSSLSTPLLTGYWPEANCIWFVHILNGNMSTYLLKIHHTAALNPLLTHASSHSQKTKKVMLHTSL